jgi:hypothetical protein
MASIFVGVYFTSLRGESVLGQQRYFHLPALTLAT